MHGCYCLHFRINVTQYVWQFAPPDVVDIWLIQLCLFWKHQGQITFPIRLHCVSIRVIFSMHLLHCHFELSRQLEKWGGDNYFHTSYNQNAYRIRRRILRWPNYRVTQIRCLYAHQILVHWLGYEFEITSQFQIFKNKSRMK